MGTKLQNAHSLGPDLDKQRGYTDRRLCTARIAKTMLFTGIGLFSSWRGSSHTFCLCVGSWVAMTCSLAGWGVMDLFIMVALGDEGGQWDGRCKRMAKTNHDKGRGLCSVTHIVGIPFPGSPLVFSISESSVKQI